MALTQGDRVYLALNATETSETKVGTMTVPIGATKIVAISGQLMQPTGTNGEMVSGQFRIQPQQTGGQFKFPAQVVAGQGAVGALAAYEPKWIPCNIPVREKDSIDCFVTADVALTGTGTGSVAVVYE